MALPASKQEQMLVRLSSGVHSANAHRIKNSSVEKSKRHTTKLLQAAQRLDRQAQTSRSQRRNAQNEMRKDADHKRLRLNASGSGADANRNMSLTHIAGLKRIILVRRFLSHRALEVRSAGISWSLMLVLVFTDGPCVSSNNTRAVTAPLGSSLRIDSGTSSMRPVQTSGALGLVELDRAVLRTLYLTTRRSSRTKVANQTPSLDALRCSLTGLPLASLHFSSITNVLEGAALVHQETP